MPIYYIIAEDKPLPGQWVTVWYTLKVIECNLEEVGEIWSKEVEPLLQGNRRIQVMYFYREPPNPFQEQK